MAVCDLQSGMNRKSPAKRNGPHVLVTRAALMEWLEAILQDNE